MRSESLLSLLLAICLASTALAGEWKTLGNCRLIENQSNDGDSYQETTNSTGLWSDTLSSEFSGRQETTVTSPRTRKWSKLAGG